MRGKAWTPEDKARACVMRGEGKTYRQIAEITAEQDAEPMPTPPVKAKPVPQAEVIPLHRPFEPRPPR